MCMLELWVCLLFFRKRKGETRHVVFPLGYLFCFFFLYVHCFLLMLMGGFFFMENFFLRLTFVPYGLFPRLFIQLMQLERIQCQLYWRNGILFSTSDHAILSLVYLDLNTSTLRVNIRTPLDSDTTQVCTHIQTRTHTAA